MINLEKTSNILAPTSGGSATGFPMMIPPPSGFTLEHPQIVASRPSLPIPASVLSSSGASPGFSVMASSNVVQPQIQRPPDTQASADPRFIDSKCNRRSFHYYLLPIPGLGN